jgi:hypothetical protein
LIRTSGCPTFLSVEHTGPGPDREDFGEAGLGEAQSSNPPDDPEMIELDADPLDTDVEDADLFLGLDDEEEDDEDLSTP